MSWFDGVPGALLYAGPPSNYTAAAAASSSAQQITNTATGNFSQPLVPSNFFQLGKSGQCIIGHLCGIVTGQATTTTMTINLGLTTTDPPAATGTTVATSGAATVTSLSAAGWEMDFKILCRGTGFGTTTVATSLISTSVLSAGTAQAVGAPVATTTIDASLNYFMYATVTFSTASATNSCTLEQIYMFGYS